MKIEGLEDFKDENVFELLLRVDGLLPQNKDKLIFHDLDYQSLLELTESEIIELGLPIGPRKRLVREIAKISHQDQRKVQENSLSSSNNQLEGNYFIINHFYFYL